MPDVKAHEVKHELGLYHFITGRRLGWLSDVLEQCRCGLWVLWEKDAPVSVSELNAEVKRCIKLSQTARTAERLYLADGGYDREGVEVTCPVCGYKEAENES